MQTTPDQLKASLEHVLDVAETDAGIIKTQFDHGVAALRAACANPFVLAALVTALSKLPIK